MKPGLENEKGFALVAAILSIAILSAMGVLVFALSTQDVRISGRMLGEKKALSAAEGGIHWLTRTFDPANLAASAVSNIPADPGNDPDSRYSISTPARPTSGAALLPMTGYSMGGGQQWGQARFNAGVTGSNTRFRSQVEIQTGVGYGPVELTTTYR